MRKAQLPDGQLVLANNYDSNTHGAKLFCPDAACHATLHFRQGTLSNGAAIQRSPAFVSNEADKHVAGCTAHEDPALQAAMQKTIVESIANGTPLLINLNIALSGSFNAVSGPSLRSTTKLQNYKTISAKNVEDMMRHVNFIKSKGGNDALDRTFVNYKGDVLKLNDFLVDTPEKFQDLLHDMTQKLLKSTEDSVTGLPRLIHFKPTHNTALSKNGYLFGTPIQLGMRGAKQLVLLQKLNTVESLQSSFIKENMDIIAQPRLSRQSLEEAKEKMGWRGFGTVYTQMDWQVINQAQFSPTPVPLQMRLKLS